MAAKGKKLIGGDGYRGVVSRFTSAVSEHRIVSDAAFVVNKLFRSTGKAAWIAGTTFIVLFVPVIYATDREQQINELEAQQATLLGA